MKKQNGNLPANSFSGLVDKLFENTLSNVFDDANWGFRGVNRQVNVPVNIRETDKAYELHLVAPGLKKEDFKVSLHGELLTVAFEHNEQHNQQNEQQGYLRKEYRMQSFSRSFTLDDTVDANKISANYTDGILHLTLPKKEGAQQLSRTIEIQ